MEAIFGVADQGVRGVVEGVTNIAGLPRAVGDLQAAGMDWALDKAGAPEWVRDAAGAVVLPRYLPGAEQMQGVVDNANNVTADVLGVDRPRAAPENFAERGVNRIGEEVGAMLVPVAGAVNKATRVGVEGARRMPGVVGRYVESAAVNPTRFVGNEVAVATGAGMGAAAANEIAPDSPGWDLVGAITGAGFVGAGTSLARGARDVGAAALGNPAFASKVVRDNVTDTIIQNSDVLGRQVDPSDLRKPIDTQELVDMIMQPAAAERVVPGFKASTADRTGDAGLAVLENSRARAAPGAFRSRADANALAVDNAVTSMRPDASPGSAYEAIAAERDRRLLEAIMGRDAAEEAAETASRNLAPQTTPTQRGSVVRESLTAARDAARDRTAQAYEAAGVGGKQVDPAPLTAALDRSLSALDPVERTLIPQSVIDSVANLGRVADDAPVPTGILDAGGSPITRPAPGADPMQLQTAANLKTELQRLRAAALADPRAEKGGRNAARVLGQMVDTVDGFITGNLDETEQAALTTARGAKFDEAERFTRQGDPVSRALAEYDGGRPKVGDDRVAGLFVSPQAMDNLFAQAATPEVRRAIRDEVLSRGDTSNPDRINRFLADYSEQIDRFPGLRDELGQAARARAAAADAGARQTALERDLGTATTPGRGTVGRYLQYSPANSRKAIREVIADKDPAKAADELVTFAGNDPDAIDGLRAAFWEDLDASSRSTNAAAETVSGVMPFVPKKMIAYLEDPTKAAVAERLYRDNPEHLANIRQLAEALRGVNSGSRIGNAVNPSGTALMGRGQAPVTLAEIGSKAYQAQIGRASWAYIGTYLAGKVARGLVSKQRAKAFELLLDKSLLDPDVAKTLLLENNPANRAALARRTKGWMGNQAATVLDMLTEDEEDETIRNVMGR
ncbi:hypothetical protein GV67_22540 [Pseudorhizobium pelagicum]|uniref:Uncharacterized protein n=2 Tax=Pseudorhizobium pelagicum TaxID=1509405 RepID=A0A922TBT6_9HYPH|nr:hypothetical protein GV67_22540 [Pseudorhizobium pelagicum]KEQ09962.1 hypothetical protein GV68_18330 [Pseudorhizobium pelagicum]